MNEEIKKLGTLFKSKRKELNLSLREVENATSIRMTHLESIEEGKYEKFLSPVYMVGFMRQYATFLGLDGEKLIQENPEVIKFSNDNKPFSSYGIGTLEVRGSMGGGIKWLPNLMWALLTVALLSGAYYFAKLLKLF